MNIWVINRKGKVYDMQVSRQSQFGIDIIDSEKSEFPLVNAKTWYDKGDFFLAKEPGGEGYTYFGVVDSYENETVKCNDITILANTEFPATKISGPSFEKHAKTLLERYVIGDPTKNLNIIDIEVRSDTKHTYQPAEPPTPTNLMSYLRNGFKKYNIIWAFDKFENGRIKTYIEKINDHIHFKDNIDGIRDWDVSTTEVGKDVENQLYIVDKWNTQNSEVITPLATYYLTLENEVTTTPTPDTVNYPTRAKTVIYDSKDEHKSPLVDVAESELKGNYYSHEIIFQASRQMAVVDISSLRIGTLTDITYKGKEYKSVLTGWKADEDSDFVEMKFGHIRSKLSELLE